MSPRITLRRLGLMVPLLSAAGAAFAVSTGSPHPESAASRIDESKVLEMDLAFFETRVARDSFAARDHAQLARLHLQRAPNSGSEDAELAQAEAHARRSLDLRTVHNGEALQVLASTLMGRHRFAQALQAGERLLAMDSSSKTARALVGEIQLELGDYQEAARSFGALLTARNELAVAPRYARWEDIRGRPAEARRLLHSALDQAIRRHGMPRSQLAWFHWRLGDLALRHGRPDEARRELETGLVLAPEDHRLLDGLGRVAMAQRHWREAIGFGKRAIAKTRDPLTLGLLAASSEMLGDSVQAAEYGRAMTAAALQQPGAVHRAWAYFQLDRGRELPTVLAKAREEIRTRRDVYAWDLLAWALYRSGQIGEAASASDKALAMGTRDASLYFHAGLIAAAAGDSTRARHRLREALDINPTWHPTQPSQARSLLGLP